MGEFVRENLFPPWIFRPLILWLLVMAAACGVGLGAHVYPIFVALLVIAVLTTLAIGGLIGWHGHWRVLPILGVVPPIILLIAWIGLWLSDPGAAGFFVLSSFFVVVVMVIVVYPLSLAVLGVGAGVGVACQRLAGVK